MLDDARGLPLTTDSRETVDLFDTTVARYLDYRLSTMDSLKSLLALDGDFVMGHCLRGYLFSLLATNRMHDRIGGSLAQAQAGIAGVSAREALHVAALGAWHAGDLVAACARWSDIITAHPQDVLALRLLHLNQFWMGNAAGLRDSVASVLPAWDSHTPGYASVLGMYAFGLEECGEYARAEECGRRAVSLNPDELWAIHAVAHVLEMQGRLHDGASWLDYPADAWTDRNPFQGHLWWHRALFFLESGNYDITLSLYDTRVRPQPSEFYLDIQNATSLLQRLQLLGVDVSRRWEELADYAVSHIDDHVLAFNEMHSMMALAATGRPDADRLLESLSAFASDTRGYSASVTETTVLPLCRAVLAWHRGEHRAAIDLLQPLRYRVDCVGGSHAQRDVFTQLLIAATMAAGDSARALSLLRERVTRKPQSVGAWQWYADQLEATGEARQAAAARARAAAITVGFGA